MSGAVSASKTNKYYDSGNPDSNPNKFTDLSAMTSELSLDPYADKPFSMNEYYDLDSFPMSKSHSVLPWHEFTRDFLSKDLEVDQKVSHMCEKNIDKLVEMRPYMIENPETCTKFDFLPKILSRFRNMHLRHLIVVNPQNNHLEGMITRQDIFTWMPL